MSEDSILTSSLELSQARRRRQRSTRKGRTEERRAIQPPKAPGDEVEEGRGGGGEGEEVNLIQSTVADQGSAR